MSRLTGGEYRIENLDELFSPGMVLYRELVEANIDQMIRTAGGPQRLRPHCKTHKMEKITQLELARGIVKHKCATIAEAEMLADAGVSDIFLANNAVGPTIGRLVRLVSRFPHAIWSVTADHPRPLAELSAAMQAAERVVHVLLDVDSGMHRTGVSVDDPRAMELYQQFADLPGLEPGGLHLYDGQNHQTALAERTVAVQAVWEAGIGLRDRLVAKGLPVPRLVAGGTGSFPLFAKMEDPTLELSPGTVVLHDAGYRRIFPDLRYTPAAAVVTRVISRPTPDRITFDLGNKAVAADPPIARRVWFPDIADAEVLIHNEEHLVVRSATAENYQPGDAVLAFPMHVCPTSALHRQVAVIVGGRCVDYYDVTARDRMLTI